MIRVALVDDQALVRAGFRALIDAEPDMEVVGEAPDGRAGVELVAATLPDLVLMDVRMPVLDGVEATRRIAGDPVLGDVRVVILTTFATDEHIVDGLRAGAAGFLVKDTEPVDLLRAIRVVVGGDGLLSPSVTRRLIEEFVTGSVPRSDVPALDLLTDREREVMALVGRGMSNDEIADHLVISPATARTHVSRAMVKLGARDRAQLVVFAYESGLVRASG